MVRVRLKGINSVTKPLANGKLVTYYYAFKGGPRLEGKPGSPEFHASYNAAVQSRVKTAKEDMRSLIDRYLRSSSFLNLAERSKKDYRYHIKWIEDQFGDLPIAALSDRRVRADFLDWRDRLGATSPRQADLAFRVLARIISWGFDRGIAPANPCQRVGLLYKSTRVDKVWTPEAEHAFMENASEQLRLALLLALWTGQRQGDLLRLTWSAYDGSHIRLKQSKTGARVEVPVGQPLRVALATAKAKVDATVDAEEIATRTILSTARGDPWSGDGFRSAWRKACIDAGIKGLTFHDLRGTAVTRLAVAGCTVPEIASITGHSLRDAETILQSHYLNRDSELATSAIRKYEEDAKRPTKPPTGS